MILSEICLKHWIKFPYDTSDAIAKIGVHYIFSVKNSIHYKTLESKNYENYEHLISSTNQREHSKKNFNKLLNNFDLKKVGKIKLEYNKSINKFLVNDGCHRLAIIVFKKIFKTEIPNEYIIYE